MVQLSYPGVYVEELSSGVHTITGVATSIAAFVGWTPMGSTDEATLVESWTDFQRQFGGFTSYNGIPNYLAYSVNQFFNNGGQQAYIIRLTWDGSIAAAPGTHPTACANAVATGIGFPAAKITATIGKVSGSAMVNVGAPVLTGLRISPAFLPPIPLNTTIQLSVIGIMSDGGDSSSSPAVIWSSSDPTVVAITPSGAATGMGPGQATLTATSTSGPLTASIAVSASGAPANSTSPITVSPSTFSLAPGQTQQLAAILHYADGTTQDATSIATWAASSGAVVISSTGLATAKSVSSGVTVTATCSGVSNKGTATVTVAEAAGGVVYPANAVVPVPAGGGAPQTVNFEAVFALADGSTAKSATPPLPPAKFAWASSNAAVADFADPTKGVATMKGVGSAVITATYSPTGATGDSLSASVPLTGTTATLSTLTITPTAPSVVAANATASSNFAALQLRLKATGFYSDGTTADLTQSVDWTSGDTASATVDPNLGVVTGVKAAAAGVKVTATAPWTTTPITGSVNVVVTPPVLQSIVVTGPGQLVTGQTSPMTASGTFSDGSTQSPLPGVTWSSSAPNAVSVDSNTGLAKALAAAGGSLTLFANSPGAWGNRLLVLVTSQTSDPTRFTLAVLQEGPNGQRTTLETFTNLSTSPGDANYVVKVVDNDSDYVTFKDPRTGVPVAPTAPPTTTTSPAPFSGGADGAVLVPASDGNFELALLNANAGVNLLDKVDIFNLLCVPAETDGPTISQLQSYCQSKRALYIVDAPQNVKISELAASGPIGSAPGEHYRGREGELRRLLLSLGFGARSASRQSLRSFSAMRLRRGNLRGDRCKPRRLEGAGRHRRQSDG